MNYQVLGHSPLDAEVTITDHLDVLRFAEFLRSRSVFVLVACAIAVVLSLVGSLLIPKKYTATASLLIEPPAGNDPRGATAISSIYLESLKTYERFAASDTVFAKALAQLNLRDRYAGSSIESLKKKVLRIDKPRDTKILEISATLPNPKDAQALAKYMAEQTVRLSESLDQQSQRELTEQVGLQLDAAAARLGKADRARTDFLASDPVEMLETDLKNGAEQKLRIENELTEARIDLVDYEARLQFRAGANPNASEIAMMREQLAASKARTAQIEKADHDLGQLLAAKGAILEKRRHQREALENERQAARAQYELATTRRNDTVASAAFRNERLEIVDPGTVP